jgi:hypothetical protein
VAKEEPDEKQDEKTKRRRQRQRPPHRSAIWGESPPAGALHLGKPLPKEEESGVRGQESEEGEVD